jgi:hypothetical protein
MFPYMLVAMWISHVFEYKHHGRLVCLKREVRGLLSSKEAALYGVTSIFLNKHSSIKNKKQADIVRFVSKYYPTDPIGTVLIYDHPERELEFLFSIMDYLGLTYIGVE